MMWQHEFSVVIKFELYVSNLCSVQKFNLKCNRTTIGDEWQYICSLETPVLNVFRDLAPALSMLWLGLGTGGSNLL